MFSKFSNSRFWTWTLRVVLAIAYGIWVIGSFVIANKIISGIVGILVGQLGIAQDFFMQPTAQLGIATAVYLLCIWILLLEPIGLRRFARQQINDLLRLVRRPELRDFGYAAVAWAGYFLVTLGALTLIKYLVPQFNESQVQQVGIDTATSGIALIPVFLLLVVVAPFAEETIFRGYLQGSLLRYMPWYIAAIFTSVAFGIVHGQWNVGIDVFVLSVVACYLREKTGSIWSGIGLHALKNCIAFVFLFIFKVG